MNNHRPASHAVPLLILSMSILPMLHACGDSAAPQPRIEERHALTEAISSRYAIQLAGEDISSAECYLPPFADSRPFWLYRGGSPAGIHLNALNPRLWSPPDDALQPRVLITEQVVNGSDPRLSVSMSNYYDPDHISLGDAKAFVSECLDAVLDDNRKRADARASWNELRASALLTNPGMSRQD